MRQVDLEVIKLAARLRRAGTSTMTLLSGSDNTQRKKAERLVREGKVERIIRVNERGETS
jgi:hypothetical protein